MAESDTLPRLTKGQIEQMVNDASFVETHELDGVPAQLVLDLCCHIKALASELSQFYKP